jgi:hypothetical protein
MARRRACVRVAWLGVVRCTGSGGLVAARSTCGPSCAGRKPPWISGRPLGALQKAPKEEAARQGLAAGEGLRRLANTSHSEIRVAQRLARQGKTDDLGSGSQYHRDSPWISGYRVQNVSQIITQSHNRIT